MRRTNRREFLGDSLLASAAAISAGMISAPLVARPARRAARNEVIRVGVIGVRGRGRGHIAGFLRSPDSEVAAICDPDEGVINLAMEAAPEAKYYRDIRDLLDDPNIDAVSIATPNHWHSLASIWAIQAGKHVYVEKPISHNVFEGGQVAAAAKKYGRIVQHGTQGRSHQATREGIAWMREGGLGKVLIARGLCYKRRQSIGKVTGPQKPPATLDYDLWTGPAEFGPLRRKNLHYDWHWVYNTGNGDIGNQGVHQMDIARWGLGQDALPTSVISCGGRLGYDDDGNTANTQIAVYDYGDSQAIFEVRGLPTDAYKTAHIGTIFHCEHGYVVSTSYSTILAFDHEGNEVKRFTGGSEQHHYQNFLEAIKSGDASSLNAPANEGHLSAALGHLGNISYRLGAAQGLLDSVAPFGDAEAANESFHRFRDHLTTNGLDPSTTQYLMGPRLTMEGDRFVGDWSAEANAMLTRNYREPFVVPAEV